jgi:type IV secretion system protein VirB8
VIRYQFSTGALSMEDRYLNPLGFQVVRYRRDAESAPTAADGEPPLTATTPGIVVPGATPTPVAPAPSPAPGTPPNPRPAARSGPEVQL